MKRSQCKFSDLSSELLALIHGPSSLLQLQKESRFLHGNVALSAWLKSCVSAPSSPNPLHTSAFLQQHKTNSRKGWRVLFNSLILSQTPVPGVLPGTLAFCARATTKSHHIPAGGRIQVMLQYCEQCQEQSWFVKKAQLGKGRNSSFNN